MNIYKGRAKFKNFQILLGSVFSPTIIMRGLITKLNLKKYYVVQWNTQAGNITTNLTVKIYFTLIELSATGIVT